MTSCHRFYDFGGALGAVGAGAGTATLFAEARVEYQNDTASVYQNSLLSGSLADAGVVATIDGLLANGLTIRAQQNAEELFGILRIVHSSCVLMEVMMEGHFLSETTPGQAFDTMVEQTLMDDPDNPAHAVAPLVAILATVRIWPLPPCPKAPDRR